MSSPHLLARPAWIIAAAVPLVAASMAKAGVPPLGSLGGMTASSYSMNASAAGRTTTSLSFASTSNAAFDPSYIAGPNTGDEVVGDGTSGSGWSLQAVGADYASVFSYPTPINVVGFTINAAAGTPDFDTGTSFGGTYQLVFSANQVYGGLNNFTEIDTTGFGSVTATLTRAGDPATDLLTTALGTTFAAGTYTLSLTGSTNNTFSDISLFVSFFGPPAAVPGGGGVALLGAMLVARRRRR